MLSTRILALCFAMAASACGDARVASDDGVTSQAIRDGVRALDYPEAVHVNADGTVCSGALLAPTVVLTAGHCVAGRSGWIVYAPYADHQFSPAASGEVLDYPAGAVHLVGEAHDVGLLHLERPIVLDRYATVASSAPPLGSEVINVGRIVDGFRSPSHVIVGGPVTLSDATPFGFPKSYFSAAVIERGDSGGPAYLRGSHEIVAVASGVSSSLQILARVDLVHDWIAARLPASDDEEPSPAQPPVEP